MFTEKSDTTLVYTPFDGEFAEITGPLGDMTLPPAPNNHPSPPQAQVGSNLYRVSFVFSLPGMFLGEDGWTIGAEKGDSYIMLSDGKDVSYEGYSVRPNLAVPIHFHMMANDLGRLGRFTSNDFYSPDMDTVVSWANDAMNSVLSVLSISSDVPLYVKQIEVVDLTLKAFWSRRIVPFRVRGISFKSLPNVSDELRLFANLYREALSSVNEAYRFLCLFKLLEGLFIDRDLKAKKQRKMGAEPVKYQEVVPEGDADLLILMGEVSIFKEWHKDSLEVIFPPSIRGWKFRRVLQEVRKTRDKIAHSLMDSGALGLSTDNLNNSRFVTYWLPLLRVLCRKVLKDQFGI